MHERDNDDVWTGGALCPECGRDACTDHLPPISPIEDGHDPLTDAGAAERFARLQGHRVRYDHRRERWLLWSTHRWRPDTTGAIVRLAIRFVRHWQRDVLALKASKDRDTLLKFTLSLERHGALMNVLTVAQSLEPITDAGDNWDADPWLLCTPAGVVDLRTGTCRPGWHSDSLTMQTAIGFDAAATCPRWDRFLAEIFNGQDALVSFIHRAVGYSLTGITTEQVLFLLYGTGANGKGTFANTLKRVLGDYAWNMPFATMELHDRSAIPNDIAALVNRRFVIASETNEGTRLNEARVKALTGCDPMTARFLHSEFFEFEPVAKFWLSVNHKPDVRDDSHGFWRRIRLIPFTRRFPLDVGLAGELQAEAPGILAWAVRGALAWQAEKLLPPPIVINATAEFEQESDQLAAFITEALDTIDPEAIVKAADAYKHYCEWATRQGKSEKERLSQTMFGRKLSERFEKLPHTKRGTFYQGFALYPLAG